jgi:catechol 2,3-dioxygenase-like lactoylglutathione lyase family enzyme
MSDQSFRVQQVDHIELFVPDQYEAAEWYQRVLGLEVMTVYTFWADEDGPLMVSSDEGNTKLALFQGEPPGFQPLVGFKRVAFRVDGPGFLEFFQRLAEQPVFNHAGQVVHTLEVIDHDRAFSVYFCDPYGNRFEVTTYDYEFVYRRIWSE